MTEEDLKYWKTAFRGVVPKELVTPEVVALRDQQNKMLNLMAKKNADYGNAFNKGCDTMGEAYALCRIFDKANRFIKQASDKMNGLYNPNVVDESLYDTIQDLGNYCNMFLAWKEHEGESIEVPIPSTGRIDKVKTKYISITNNLSKGIGCIRVEGFGTDVTDYIIETYGLDNLCCDSQGYVYNVNADDKFVSVTSAGGDLCVYYNKDNNNKNKK